jgi:2-dehydropantoate 2-reductase
VSGAARDTATAAGTPRVVVVGAGAVGSFFGARLAQAGVDVTLVGRPAHVEAVRRGGLVIESATFGGAYPVKATTELSAASGAGIILVATKTVDTESTARELAAHASPDAVAVSLQNGVENAPQIHGASGLRTVPAAVYVAAELIAPGKVRHLGRGDLTIGTSGSLPSGATSDDVARVAALFARAGVPCRVVDDIAPELWTKLAMNCGYNAISALTRATYGEIAADPEAAAVVRDVLVEVVAVARASGVPLDEGTIIDAAVKLGLGMREALSSTAHDLIRGRRTEIGALNGFIVRRARELQLPAPANAALTALVRLAEQERSP